MFTEFSVIFGVEAEVGADSLCERVVGDAEVGPQVDKAVLCQVEVLVHGDRGLVLPGHHEIARVVRPCNQLLLLLLLLLLLQE